MIILASNIVPAWPTIPGVTPRKLPAGEITPVVAPADSAVTTTNVTVIVIYIGSRTRLTRSIGLDMAMLISPIDVVATIMLRVVNRNTASGKLKTRLRTRLPRSPVQWSKLGTPSDNAV